jgi:hypothetical protein
MGRPVKDTVDYFPHYCVHKSTMFIIEQRYGNDGYAFWFKLLEILGSTEGHYLDCNDLMRWEFLQAKTRTNESFCTEILDLLCRLNAIDPELWKKRIIWSQNFIDGIAEVYRNRRKPVPSKPAISGLLGVETELLDVETPAEQSFYSQSMVEKRQSRVEKRKEENITPPYPPLGGDEDVPKIKSPKKSDMTTTQRNRFERFWSAYPKKVAKGKAEKAWKSIPIDEPMLEQMLRKIEESKLTDMWRKDNGQFIPYPASWLNAKRWLDDLDSGADIEQRQRAIESAESILHFDGEVNFLAFCEEKGIKPEEVGLWNSRHSRPN